MYNTLFKDRPCYLHNIVKTAVVVLACTALISAQPADGIKKRTGDWNKAHNTRNYALLRNIYASRVMAYGTSFTADDLIKQKQKFIKKNPDFAQEIQGEISVSFTDETTAYVSFVKEGTIKGKTKEYPSYLEFKLIKNEWRIITESDEITDANLTKKKQKKSPTQCEDALYNLLATTQWFNEQNNYYLKQKQLGNSGGMVVMLEDGYDSEEQKVLLNQKEYSFWVFENMATHSATIARIRFFTDTERMFIADYLTDNGLGQELPLSQSALEEFRKACK